jgi:putative transcriptional regulator
MNRSNDRWNADMNSLQGHFLAASPHQLDPDFIEAVVLVVEHDDLGAMGVIVNCPRDRHEGISPQRSAQRRWPEEPRLYFGGPMTGPLMAVHADEACAGIEILPGVFLEEEEERVFTLMRSTERPYKAFTGYTGWEPRQLEHEIECGIWRAIPATAAEIFSNGDNLWERLLREALDSLLQVLFNVKHIPSDASVN